MECDCPEATSCEGLPESSIRKEPAKCAWEHRKVVDTRIEPLFSLPTDLMGCARCIRKYEKRRQRQREVTYTGKRLKTECFRRFTAGLTVKPELPHVDVDLNNDQDVNRYYNYICNGVDTILTAQIQADIVEDILKLIPYSLRERFNYYADDLLAEVKEDFTRNIKKAILQFALQDPLQGHRLEDSTSRAARYFAEEFVPDKPMHGDDLGPMGFQFSVRDCSIRGVTFPRPIRSGNISFRSFRLIDFNRIQEHRESWDLAEFQSTVLRQIDSARNVLKNSWYSGIQDIFLVNNRKNLVPSPMDRWRFKRFFECVGKIMESQLMYAFKKSLKDFMDMVVRCQPVGVNFNANMVVVSDQLEFEPSFDGFKYVLCNILESMCEAVRNFQKLESQLYLDWAGPLDTLKPKIEQSIVEEHKRDIVNLIDRERLIPEQILSKLQM
ncbi:dynein axonemal heavy chain 7 [Andrena cerasifolii]|uniref:dynein axonemal heavy chain 7 n=1 Tax=Andrena cerasifolii TaxID=2819439 RepID=UPI00403783C4